MNNAKAKATIVRAQLEADKIDAAMLTDIAQLAQTALLSASGGSVRITIEPLAESAPQQQ